MWNDIWRQRQESETSVWRTHLTSTSLFAAHSSKPFTYIITDADLCKHTRKRFSVTYKNTISYSCVDSGTILLPNANNIQQGHFLEQQWRTMASLSRLRLTWYSLLVHWSKMTPNAGRPIQTILSKHIFHTVNNQQFILSDQNLNYPSKCASRLLRNRRMCFKTALLPPPTEISLSEQV